MANKKTIKAALNNFIFNILDKENYYMKLGKVTIVNPFNFTFFFEPNDGSALQEVNMSVVDSASNAFILVPELNSLVLVAYTDKETPYCIAVEKTSEILFNEGLNEGLINIIPQTLKLNALITEIQAELVKIQTGIIGAGGAYTPGTLTSLNKTDFEDTTVKH